MTQHERTSIKNALCWTILVLWIAIVIWRKIEVRRHMVNDAADKTQQSLATLRSAKKNRETLAQDAKKLRKAALLGRQLLEARKGQADALDCLSEIAALAKNSGIRYHGVNLSAGAREDPLAGPLLRFRLYGSYDGIRNFLWRLETSPTMAARIVALKLKGGLKGTREGVTGNLTLNLRTGWKVGLETLKEVTAHGKPKAGRK